MQLKIKAKDLKNLKHLIRKIEKKHFIEVLGYLKVNLVAEQKQLVFTAQNSAFTSSVKISIDGKANEGCEFLLDSVKFYKIISLFKESEEILLSINKANISIKHGKSRLTLKKLSAEDYPGFKDSNNLVAKIDSEQLYNATTMALAFMVGKLSTDRTAMIQTSENGCFLVSARSVGLCCSHMTKSKIIQHRTLLLDKTAIEYIRNVASGFPEPIKIELHSSDKTCVLKCNELTISIPLVELNYSKYVKSISYADKYSKLSGAKINILLRDLKEKLKEINTIVNEESYVIKISKSESGITMRLNSKDGKAEVDFDVAEIGNFDKTYFIYDSLNKAISPMKDTENELQITFTGETSPTVITQLDTTIILMPARSNNYVEYE